MGKDTEGEKTARFVYLSAPHPSRAARDACGDSLLCPDGFGRNALCGSPHCEVRLVAPKSRDSGLPETIPESSSEVGPWVLCVILSKVPLHFGNGVLSRPPLITNGPPRDCLDDRQGLEFVERIGEPIGRSVKNRVDRRYLESCPGM